MAGNGSDNDGSWEQWLRSRKADNDKFFSDLTNDLDDELRRQGNTSSPFSAFKRFIDSNFNALTDGFKNFPANVAELKAKMQREQERLRQEELDISRRWTGSDDSPDHVQMELLRSTKMERADAHQATMMLLSEAQRHNANVPQAKIEELFRDPENMLGDLDRLVNPMLALGGAWYYMPETGDKIPTADSFRWLAPQPRWLSVDWFKRSPYSPVRLEAHPDLGSSGSKWRAAFEDLMDAALDKPMTSKECLGMREPYGKPQSTYYGPGLEWFLSLQCRGKLPPLLPRAYNDAESKHELRSMPLLDALSRHKADLALTTERSMSWNTAIYKDFSDIMSEVATKSTSHTEYEPWSKLRIEAETEQDLYDSPYVYAPTAVVEASTDAVARETVPTSLASLSTDEDEYKSAILDALDARDAPAVADVIEDWYDVYGDVAGLITRELWSEIPEERISTWIEALQLSALPRDAWGKGLPEDVPEEEFDTQLRQQRDLIQRREEIEMKKLLTKRIVRLDESFDENDALWSYTIDELVDLAESLEEEYKNLQRMVGEKKQGPAVQNKPQVLSALTTTETTRLPDGTVTTKVVLKKRFSDGREETSESVHTTNEKLEQQHEQAEENKPKKKGWFWS